MTAVAPFTIREELAAIAIAYRNSELIADAVLPYMSVGRQVFEYLSFTKQDAFTIPDTTVGRTGQPNQIEFSSTLTSATCIDYALDTPVPNADIANASGKQDPLGNATELVTDLVLLDREKRVADLVFAAGTYPTGNKQTLATTARWSDHTNSDPIGDILGAMDGMIARPNKMVLGKKTWRYLRTHPKIAKAIHGNSGDTDIVARQAVADLFELSQGVHIGMGWYNSANKGQTATYTEIWGPHCALLREDPLATTQRGVTFGYTARWGERFGGTIDDPDMGARGGQRVRAGESVKELITASDAGYLFTNAGDDA